MKRGSRVTSWLRCGVVMCAGVWSASASAGDFSGQGKLEMDAAFAVSFDQPLESGVFSEGLSYRGQAVDVTFGLVEDADELEGSGALEIPGSQNGVALFLGSQWDRFQGRRIEVTLWYKPQGTSLRASMEWYSGSGRTWITGDFDQPAMMMGRIIFHPTGRATSDGWIELSSGEFDYQMGTFAPEFLSLRDTQHLAGERTRQQLPTDVDVSLLVDALEVHDRGAASVPDVACNGANEEMVCGSKGACLVGQCVDASAMLGHVPDGPIGDDYVARRLFELDAFSGARFGRRQLPQITTLIQGLDRSAPRAYWGGLSKAHELMIDGHGSPPRDSVISFYHPSGVCLGPGLADLSPIESRRAQMLPMVFSTNSAFTAGAKLQRGDVLHAIDGVDVWTWVEDHPELFYYNGDARGRSSVQTLNIIQAAKTLGSTLTFERCTRADGLPCDAAEALSIEVDFSQDVGALLWANTPPQDLYDYTNECDMRFEREVSVPINAASYYFAGHRDQANGIRHLIINGVPGSDDAQGQSWHRAVNGALGAGVGKLVLDQRTGYGGTFEGVARVIGHLLDPFNQATTLFVPWVGETFQGAVAQAFHDCASQSRSSFGGCGNYSEISITDINASGGSSMSKLAVLNGFDVSGNDYLSRFLDFRAAPTKIFGYGPAIGAYGASCSFASYLWEASAMRYQCHDSRFGASPTSSFGSFESGKGVMPDEVIYQLQSDAIANEDTMIKAAHQWLLSPDGEVMP